MLIGAHVSPAGGPAKAIARGIERGAASIQIFNQNPRAWKPREYSEEEISDFRDAFADSEIGSLVIHAVYLLNCGSENTDIRSKSIVSLKASLQAGDRLGSDGVILHPGSALKGATSPDAALTRAAEAIRESLTESQACPLLLENTAGAGGTLGRSFDELARLLEASGGDERIGVCLDSAHLLASGYDIRTYEGLDSVLDDFDAIVGLDRLRCLHVNDSQAALGDNRDRHASLGEGELGVEGCVAFLSHPRFEGLPCIYEGPGTGGEQVEALDMAIAWRMRAEGLAARVRS